MRALPLLLALCLPSAAPAWEFSPTPICTLRQEQNGTLVEVTFEHGSRLYAIAITRAEPWPVAPGFTITFEGPAGITIGTDRHVLSDAGRTLRVEDTGSGNVLNGLALNQTARARSGAAETTFSLTDAAPEVEAFRACTVPLAV